MALGSTPLFRRQPGPDVVDVPCVVELCSWLKESVEHQDQQRSSMACPSFVCCILLFSGLLAHLASGNDSSILASLGCLRDT